MTRALEWRDVNSGLPELAVHRPKDQKDPDDFEAWWSHDCYVAGNLAGGKRIVRKGHYEKGRDGERWETEYNGWWEDELLLVTHWMPIPPPPPWPKLPEEM